MYLSQCKITSENGQQSYTHACRPLSLRHRCWIQRQSTIDIVALVRIVLAFLISVKQWRGQKMRVQQSQITTSTGSIPNAENGYLRAPGPQRWSRIILMMLLLFTRLPLLFKKKTKWSRIYHNTTFKGYFSSLRNFQYSGTLLNGHPWIADTHDITDNSESPNCPSIDFNT